METENKTNPAIPENNFNLKNYLIESIKTPHITFYLFSGPWFFLLLCFFDSKHIPMGLDYSIKQILLILLSIYFIAIKGVLLFFLPHDFFIDAIFPSKTDKNHKKNIFRYTLGFFLCLIFILVLQYYIGYATLSLPITIGLLKMKDLPAVLELLITFSIVNICSLLTIALIRYLLPEISKNWGLRIFSYVCLLVLVFFQAPMLNERLTKDLFIEVPNTEIIMKDNKVPITGTQIIHAGNEVLIEYEIPNPDKTSPRKTLTRRDRIPASEIEMISYTK